MGKISFCPSPRLRPNRRRATIAVLFTVYLIGGLLWPAPAHALDPDKRLTQYIRTSWRIQNGSAPSGMYTIAQTSDGFLWFLSSRGEIYRFDGVQFVLWRLPAAAGSIGRIRNIVGDQSGGMWALGANGIVRLKGGLVTSHFELEGLAPNASNISEDADGSLWVVRGENGISEPVCHVTERAIKCFGKPNGIPISPIDAILADGRGGFWLGGQAALVHWHDSVSEMYPIEGLKSNTGAPGIMSLARGPDGGVRCVDVELRQVLGKAWKAAGLHNVSKHMRPPRHRHHSERPKVRRRRERQRENTVRLWLCPELKAERQSGIMRGTLR